MNKTEIKFFTIADYEEEELWLREKHRNGYKLVKMVPPCFYVFEECEKEDVIYRLDYKYEKVDDDYLKMLEDFGWEYFADCFNWYYFRKQASKIIDKEDGELFSDNASRAEMITSVHKTRMIPLMIIFICCIIPNVTRLLSSQQPDAVDKALSLIFCALFVLYIYLIVYCSIKLRKLKEKYSN